MSTPIALNGTNDVSYEERKRNGLGGDIYSKWSSIDANSVGDLGGTYNALVKGLYYNRRALRKTREMRKEMKDAGYADASRREARALRKVYAQGAYNAGSEDGKEYADRASYDKYFARAARTLKNNFNGGGLGYVKGADGQYRELFTSYDPNTGYTVTRNLGFYGDDGSVEGALTQRVNGNIGTIADSRKELSYNHGILRSLMALALGLADAENKNSVNFVNETISKLLPQNTSLSQLEYGSDSWNKIWNSLVDIYNNDENPFNQKAAFIKMQALDSAKAKGYSAPSNQAFSDYFVRQGYDFLDPTSKSVTDNFNENYTFNKNTYSWEANNLNNIDLSQLKFKSGGMIPYAKGGMKSLQPSSQKNESKESKLVRGACIKLAKKVAGDKATPEQLKLVAGAIFEKLQKKDEKVVAAFNETIQSSKQEELLALADGHDVTTETPMAKIGTKLDYIKSLTPIKCPEGYEIHYFKAGGACPVCKAKAAKKEQSIYGSEGCSIKKLNRKPIKAENGIKVQDTFRVDPKIVSDIVYSKEDLLDPNTKFRYPVIDEGMYDRSELYPDSARVVYQRGSWNNTPGTAEFIKSYWPNGKTSRDTSYYTSKGANKNLQWNSVLFNYPFVEPSPVLIKNK